MKILGSIAFITLLITQMVACSNPGNRKNRSDIAAPAMMQKQFGYEKGQQVPSDMVCMVNDEFMGKKQLAVPLNGKTYYGCCENCKERIPKDEKVRYAIDPQTGSKADKARAYIVLIGDGGQVAYFEHQDNYRQFLNQNKAL